MLPQLPPKTCILPWILQLPPQPQHVADKMLGRIVGKGCRCIVVACAGRTLAAAALVEKNDPVSVGVEKASRRLVTARSRPAVHEHDRLAVSRAVFFPINLVLWVLLDSQMAQSYCRGVRISDLAKLDPLSRIGCVHGDGFASKLWVWPSPEYKASLRAGLPPQALDSVNTSDAARRSPHSVG